ncbi:MULTISPECIES: preprotein translocase subunit SecG [unclassified Actinomyces]|uniref:preprotein translocase subunit SecG n=1 Tax=unclassified Actinomyces TaxID=2609248 RepID=UPI002017F598|nr:MULTISPECIES: preprotein translocase subunit SecG [unclassified Actinomyces]MCL3777489.1 preprotein translocase subunit SecG [Actinomyces sp. AC-20-1]MCL3788929.1 preprotein translocase subunit SecG [Actinomyces sp. 187325]MCL3791565.1 preprotein translocase subunit SecG [Actinomyces sp. 186855]MCL3794098.1 preprotein translocase subunit SecG [Actinomyces sp. 217892]
MTILEIVLKILLVLSSFFLIATVLLHKGRGGGLSDMFGGGVSSAAGSSGVAERNLNRITIGVGIVWAIAIIGLGLVARFA